MLTDKISMRAPTEMPPLLGRLTERKPETLDYLGVSYGLTSQLLRFVQRIAFSHVHRLMRFQASGGEAALYRFMCGRRRVS